MKITVEYTNGGYFIYCASHGLKSVAGPRLFRGLPHPDIKFGKYELAEAAHIDAQKLQSYLDALPVKKISKEKLRQYKDQ